MPPSGGLPASTRRRGSMRSKPSTVRRRSMPAGFGIASASTGGRVALHFIDAPARPKPPEGALPDGRVAIGTHDIARAWLAEPVTRYDHGILGDKIEAGSLVIETRDGKQQTVRLKNDAVFEDLSAAPRRSRRRRARRGGRGQILSQARLGAGGDRRAARQIRDRRRDAAARRPRTAGSIPPASPISTATAKWISRWCASRM